MSKTIDAGNDVSGVLSQSVEDDAQRFCSCLVRGFGETNGPFRSRKRFVPGTESETGGFFTQQHGSEIPVADADLAVVGN